MIRRYVLHLEWHRGHRPLLKIRRADWQGRRFVNGGEPGHLIRCHICDGDGFLHVPDQPHHPGKVGVVASPSRSASSNEKGSS